VLWCVASCFSCSPASLRGTVDQSKWDVGLRLGATKCTPGSISIKSSQRSNKHASEYREGEFVPARMNT
jgi:hypothetical protein